MSAAIIFVQSKEVCDNLYINLKTRGGYDGLVATLSAGLDNDDRVAAMQDFVSGKTPTAKAFPAA